MDLIREYRSFISSYYLGEGLRITSGAVVPALVLHHFGLLPIGILVSLGAVCVSAADSPGPAHHRRNGMQACIACMFFVSLITGYVAPFPYALGCWIAVSCFIFSMIGVYGGRVISIGVASMLVMVLTINRAGHGWNILLNALYVSAGAIWYMLLSLVLYAVRPYRVIQQALGDCIIATSAYLRTRAKFYDTTVNFEAIYRELMDEQVQVQRKQELVRELLYKSRRIVRDSTVASRTLMMLFIDTVDMFEKAASAFYPYEELHHFFRDTEILTRFRDFVLHIATALEEIGIAVQSGNVSAPPDVLQEKLADLQLYFNEFRSTRLNGENLESLISLRKILQAIEDMVARITTLHHQTKYDKKTAGNFKPSGDYDKFVTHTDISWKLLRDNLSLQSDSFRHALRVSIAAIAGYGLSRLVMLGHSYWILLTIIVILKPAYSITKKRNYERVLGTIGGAFAGLVILYFIKDSTALFVIMLVFMIGTYSFVRTNYLVAVVFMTPYILLLFHLLNNGTFKMVLTDRLLDTAIGSAIAFAANFLLLPAWEHEQFKKYQVAAIDASLDYYQTAAQSFTKTTVMPTLFRLSRKHAFVALANLSDAFSRILAEPKSKQKNAQQLHQFVVLVHMLTSHIATLAYFSETLAAKYRSPDFAGIIAETTHHLLTAKELIENPETSLAPQPVSRPAFIVNTHVKELVAKRNIELRLGFGNTATRLRLSELKPIADQFQFIAGIASDLRKASEGKTL